MTKPRWLNLTSAIIALLVLTCTGLGYAQYRTRQALQDLEWSNAVSSHGGSYSTMTLELGVIQFLKSGFSVKLDSAEVTSTGVVLVGEFGNPKALSLSAVTLEFEVEKPMWPMRKAWEKDRFGFLFGDSLTVGKAQVSIGDVAVGGTTHFRIAIPNIKGDLKAYTVIVRLSGERYQYLR